MGSKRIKDLSIQLGMPYVYVHQGDCEHLIVFSDISIVTMNFDESINYPRLVKISRKVGIKCSVCPRICKWITHGNKRCPEEWMYWCDECFRRFNYDSENKKIGEFAAYSYLDNKALM